MSYTRELDELNVKRCLQAERSLIGSILLDPDILDNISYKIEARDFIDPVLHLLYKAIHYLYEKEHPIDVVTVTSQLDKYDRLGEIGGVEFLSELMTESVTAHNYKHYVSIIKTNSIKKRVYEAGEELKHLVEQEEFDTREDLFQKVEEIADSVRDRIDIETEENEEDILVNYLDRLENKEDRIETGFKKFDGWSGGLGRGWLYVLSARPSTGKTAKMLQMARNMSRKEKGAVILFSLEMQKNELYDRLTSSITSVPLVKYAHRDSLKNHEKESIAEALKEKVLPYLPYIFDKPGISLEEIRAISRRIKRKEGQLSAIFIDYLSLIKKNESSKYKTESQVLGDITKKCKEMALSLNCPVILLAQINREGERADKPSMMHLKDSGSIEQDADVIEILYHDEEDTRVGRHSGCKVIQSRIVKGRSIGVNHFRYAFDGAYQKFHEL